MMKRVSLLAACLALSAMAGCSDRVVATDEMAMATDDYTAKMGDVPFRVMMTWTVDPMLAPGFPLGLSTFDGLCSVPSTWRLAYTIDGTAQHMGRISGEGSHCAVVEWGPGGTIVGGSGSDGHLRLVAADGAELNVDQDMVESGSVGVGGAWWASEWTIISGTGRFAGATGSGMLYGTFLGFDVPAPVEMEGTLSY